MKTKPDISGIDRRWVAGEDDRVWLSRYSGLTRKQTDRALDALRKLLVRKPRTKFVGFGTFEWKRWRNRIPTGRFVETWRLAFRPSRYAPFKYKGEER